MSGRTNRRHRSLLSQCVVVMLLIVVFAPAAWAQSGKIAGRVVDADGDAPLPGANVTITGTTQGAITDAEGYYFILNVFPGEYSVTASFVGYQGLTKTGVVVNTDATATVDFELGSEVLEGDEVVVMAERPPVRVDRTSTEQFVNEETINRAPIQSVTEAMQLQAGVDDGRFRGGDGTQVVYLLDNINLNSGLISDNYTAVNLSTIEEISVLTGGYNAEYGNAQSAIVNVITKGESARRIGGTLIGRFRPAGKYHFGRNFYSTQNHDWTGFDLDYWTDQSQTEGSGYFGEDPQQLLQRWQNQITPSDTLGDYTERPEYETEVTLYGPISEGLSFLASGRYKRGVSVYPQSLPYNPEFNLQGKLSYRLANAMKLRLSGLFGQAESVSGQTNFNTEELSQEMAWFGGQIVNDPYAGHKYAPAGAFLSWPRLRKVGNVTAELEHVLSPSTFYEIQLSYLSDVIDASDREGIVPDHLWSFDQDEFDMIGHYLMQGYLHAWDNLDSKVMTLSGDVTSQVTRNHQLKAGGAFRSYNLSYEHVMAANEGGERWNLVNAFDGKPFEGDLFVQDKIEYGGLIMNAGLRLDFFHQNRDAATNMFDPLAFQETTPGNQTPGIPGNPETERTNLQLALAPRLGFSHPITEHAVLHFYYGHFYQRPSWNRMLGFPFINFTTDPEKVTDPFSGEATFMDQWQGYFGNPEMTFEKTVQYEIGLNTNIANVALFSLTGYYKDLSQQADSWTWLYNASNHSNIPIMVSNAGFADSRGLEFRVDTRLDFPLNLMLAYDVSYNTGGEVGYSELFELGSGIDSRHGYGQFRYPWSRQNRVKGLVNLVLPESFGPAVGGYNVLGDLSASMYFQWREGQPYTYHGPGDPSTEPNNRRWFNHFTSNLKVEKGFTVSGLRSALAVDVRNVFNNKDLNRLFGDDLIYYHENSNLPLEERLPKHWWSDEPNEWGWYNMSTNPPRQVYVQLRMDF